MHTNILDSQEKVIYIILQQNQNRDRIQIIQLAFRVGRAISETESTYLGENKKISDFPIINANSSPTPKIYLLLKTFATK
jgi:hypothetical protein